MTPIIVQSDIHFGTFKSDKDRDEAYESPRKFSNSLSFHDTFAIDSHGIPHFSNSTKEAEATPINEELREAIRKVAPKVFGPKPFDPFDL